MCIVFSCNKRTQHKGTTMTECSDITAVRSKRRRSRRLRKLAGEDEDSFLNETSRKTTKKKKMSVFITLSICLTALLACLSIALIGTFAQTDQQQQQHLPPPVISDAPPDQAVNILPPPHLRPNVHVNIRDWTRRLSEEIRAVSNKTSCLHNIERFYEKRAEFSPLDPVKIRDNILNQINNLLAQHTAAVNAIVNEAEKLAVTHTFVKNLRVNYTDVHRLRNELDPPNSTNYQVDQSSPFVQSSDQGQWSGGQTGGQAGGAGGSQVPQFTSINGGTPVLGLAIEWQTPFKSIVMQVNKNFGDTPVNTSMSAIHLPLPIYAGLPEIMNGIAWTERLDSVFKRNLANFMHVHHQYYGDHLGFMRTFPAHKWRIPRTDPDLFDARTRPWYSVGASSPKDVVILVDTSGSMTGLRREIAKGIVFEILDTLTNNDYFSVMKFSETVTPIGLPKCLGLKTPKMGQMLDEQCHNPMDQREKFECHMYRKQWDNRGQYLRDHPNVVLGKNGSYLTDELYKKSIFNITNEISDAYLLPATSRNIRYLKSNFSMPTAGIANFTHALMSAFELLQAYNRTGDGSQCNQAIMLITDGAIKSHDDIFNRYNYPNSPIRVFTYMIGREVGDITHTKAMACSNRGYYTHVINLSEVREQVQKYLPVMARPMVLAHHHPISWTYAYGDETHQVLTDWVLEIKRRERARIMLNEERERLNEANSTDVINIELTNITEYDELPLVDEELKNRIICEDNGNNADDPSAMDQSLHDEIDPLGYNDLACHWTSRRADLLTSVVKPVFDNRNTTLLFQRVLNKNIWTEQETHVRNAQLLGVAAVDLRIADIMKMAPSYLLGPNGYAILMGQNGFLMHHPDLRALLEDPFDKQSKILKPYFSSVDFTHIEQVHHKSANDSVKQRNDDIKLLKLREAAVRRQTGYESIFVKRAVDCRRRLHIRQQVFYYGPIKDTPFSFMIALPQNYGLNRLIAKMDLDQYSPSNFKPSAFDLWTVHPDYKYCEIMIDSQSTTTKNAPNNGSSSSVATILEVMDAVASGSAGNIVYDDLSSSSGPSERHNGRIVCDKELFPSLLFDAAATYEQSDSFCGSTTPDSDCDRPSSAFSSFYASSSRDESCARTPEEMRSKLVNIHGLEMSFLATRSGLTRVRVFDLTPRIKKLADLFIGRHNRAVDEAWYSRTVDWNMRFHESATIITVPYNAYIRLIAKLRQRITQRHPAVNDTRANCDPLLYEEGPDEGGGGGGSQSISGGEVVDAAAAADNNNNMASTTPTTATITASRQSATKETTMNEVSSSDIMIQNDEEAGSSSVPAIDSSGATSDTTSGADQLQVGGSGGRQRINYSQYSSFDFLDLLTNSSVHISATQSVITNKGGKHRSPVAVSGLLYDYATFARRFLNATSLNIRVLDPLSSNRVKVDICPGGDCPTKCGIRNDTIDCLLVDNNGFIIVGEELPHIGRPLSDYDEKLMESLVEKRVFHQVQITDYQAICTRNDQVDQQKAPFAGSGAGSGGVGANPQAFTSSSSTLSPLKWDIFFSAILSNIAASVWWMWSTIYTLVVYQATFSDISSTIRAHNYPYLQQMQRSVLIQDADAQSAIANQSLLALLPNKTYLRPCERTLTLYETRPIDPSKLASESPEYFVTKCGCSGWYVYDAVPKTNLIMLIVNTTTACRRCEPPTAAQVSSNFVPVAVAPIVDPMGNLQPPGGGGGYVPGNKTAEDQVCTMLEREAQLYVKKPETCYMYHPEEAHIHICGGATLSAPISNLLIFVLLLFAFLFTPFALNLRHSLR